MYAIFLDRDGTIINDVGYPTNTKQIELYPETIPTLKAIQAQGYKFFIVTNQSAVAKKYMSIEQAHRLNDYVIQICNQQGVNIIKAYLCPHNPEDNCDCRKPKAGMLHGAMTEFHINPTGSYMVGDKESDIEAGKSAGCKTVRVGCNQSTETNADFCIGNISELVQVVDSPEGIDDSGK